MAFFSFDKTPGSNTSIGGYGVQSGDDAANTAPILRDLAAAGKKFALDIAGAVTVGGTADAITLTLNDTDVSAYFDGMEVGFVATADNTLTTTSANANSIGAKTIKKASASDGAEASIAAGDIQSGGYYKLRYRSAWASAAGAWQLIDQQHPAAAGLSNIVEDTTPQFGGAVDTNGFAINESEGSAVASATAPNIWVTDGNTLHITGTTTITDFADAPRIGAWRKLIFDGALTLTHGSGITLPGSANITTAAGDIAFVYADAVDAFRVAYFKADGTAVVAPTTSSWTQHSSSPATPASSGNTFGSIPAEVEEIMIVTDQLRGTTLGSAEILGLQIGDSGGLETSGYGGMRMENNNVTAHVSNGASWILHSTIDRQNSTVHMRFTVNIKRIITGQNMWMVTSIGDDEDAAGPLTSAVFLGNKDLSDELTQLKLYPTAGTFDVAGTISVWYK